MPAAREIGRFGEEAAARYLRKRGYELLAANVRCRFGEIDLIARDRTYILFAEVKTRPRGAPVGGAEAVDARKRARLWRTAEYYLAAHPTDRQPRFDVLEVEYRPGDPPKVLAVRHLENAFTAEDLGGSR